MNQIRNGAAARHTKFRRVRGSQRIASLFGAGLLVGLGSVFAATPDHEVTDDQPEVRPVSAITAEILVTATMPDLATELDVTGDTLEQRGVRDIAGGLRAVRGVDAVRRGSINLEPTVRGLQETQVAQFVDGTRTFAAGPARMDSGISHINPHMVMGLRVIKGPYALTWGAGTMSAVELETRKPAFSIDGFRWLGGVALGFAENGGQSDGHARIGAGGERFRILVAAGYREGSDYEAGDGSPVAGDYESTDTRWHVGFQPNGATVIEWTGGYQEQFGLEYPGRLLDATYFYHRANAISWSRTAGGPVKSVYSQLFSNRKDHRMNNDAKPTAVAAPGRTPPFALRVDLPTEANTQGGRVRVGIQDGAVDWTLGADAYRVEQSAERRVLRRSNNVLLFRDIVWPDAEIEDVGVYGQAVWNTDGHRLGATVRVDAVDATAGSVSPFFLANTSEELDQSETNFSAAVSGLMSLAEHWILRGGAGRSVRTATALERYSDRFPATKFQLAAEFMGNPTLDPEAATEIDLGLQATVDKIRFQLDTFYRVIDDYITVVPDATLPRRLPLSPPTVYRYVNGQEATFYGGEARLDHRLEQVGTVQFAWHVALSWIRGEDEALDEPVLGIAPLTATVGARLVALDQRLTIDTIVRIRDRQDRVATSRFERATPGHTTVDLAGHYRFDNRWMVSVGIDNIADESYADHLNAPDPFNGARVPEPGRSIRFGFDVRY